jgi:hypothetical protein
VRISDGMWVPRKETISTLCIYLAFFHTGIFEKYGGDGILHAFLWGDFIRILGGLG